MCTSLATIAALVWPASNGQAFDVSGGYGYLRHQSRDPLEQYTAHIVWLGTHVGF